MRTARFDFRPRPSYLSMERPKPQQQEPVPDGVTVQVITHVPEPVEPWVRHLRELRRIMTQEEIAKAAGIAAWTISRYVNRTHNPSTTNANKIKKLWEELC